GPPADRPRHDRRQRVLPGQRAAHPETDRAAQARLVDRALPARAPRVQPRRRLVRRIPPGLRAVRVHPEIGRSAGPPALSGAGGPNMIEIRNLLLDCRAALRRADRKFESTPLAEVLDDEIIRIGRESEPRPASEEPAARPHALPIAYAWQAAARELRSSHPEVHELLSRRVHERLREKVMDSADDEIDALRAELQKSEAC